MYYCTTTVHGAVKTLAQPQRQINPEYIHATSPHNRTRMVQAENTHARTCSIRTTSLIPAPPRSNGLANASTHDTNSSADTPPPPPPPSPLRAASRSGFEQESTVFVGFSGQSSTTLIPNTETAHCLSILVTRFAHNEENSGGSPSATAGGEMGAAGARVGGGAPVFPAAPVAGSKRAGLEGQTNELVSRQRRPEMNNTKQTDNTVRQSHTEVRTAWVVPVLSDTRNTSIRGLCAERV